MLDWVPMPMVPGMLDRESCNEGSSSRTRVSSLARMPMKALLPKAAKKNAEAPPPGSAAASAEPAAGSHNGLRCSSTSRAMLTISSTL